jgi:hypothetical protein
MFAVRPIPQHFILWVLLAPLFLVETYALREFLQLLALQDASRTGQAQAQITDWRASIDGIEIRYQFHVDGSPQEYTATSINVFGGAVWVPISREAWQRARQQGQQVTVTYLRNNPWINQPNGRVGSPLGDSFLAWILFLVFDMLWIAETIWIVRNYMLCQAAAERREARRMRFWRSVPVG